MSSHVCLLAKYFMKHWADFYETQKDKCTQLINFTRWPPQLMSTNATFLSHTLSRKLTGDMHSFKKAIVQRHGAKERIGNISCPSVRSCEHDYLKNK